MSGVCKINTGNLYIPLAFVCILFTLRYHELAMEAEHGVALVIYI